MRKLTGGNFGREFCSWGLAVILAFISMNAILLLFYNPADEITRSNASTPGIMFPNDWVLYGDEGWGYSHIDENGYVNCNASALNADDYVIAIGSSHTEGFHVSGRKWSEQLERELGKPVYNIGHSGYSLPAIATNFESLTQEFPNASTIVIELNGYTLTHDAVAQSLEQPEYDSNQSYSAIVSRITWKDRVKHTIKKMLTFVRKAHEQVLAMEKESSVDQKIEATREDLNAMLAMMRSEFDGEIILVYHPTGEIVEGKGLAFDTDSEYELLGDCCRKNGIDYIDLSEQFLQEYKKNYTVGHGFWNTCLGTGHMNGEGCRILATAVKNMMEGH